MCAHYEAPAADNFFDVFNAQPPKGLFRTDIWPAYESVFIRRPRHADAGDEAVPAREAVRGLFGLVPHWSKDLKSAKRTYNARSETVAEKPSFRDAWRAGQRCIIPAAAIYEPDWRSGKAVSTRITHADGQPLGIAGLWASWRSPEGDIIDSFTMLTVNADEHELMKHYHRPSDEKRMVVVVPRGAYDDWLNAAPGQSMYYLLPYPAERLAASAAP
jgi:putative SOS response-associated peptidase YedK